MYIASVPITHSSVAGSVPDAAEMKIGALAVNVADAAIYTKDYTGAIKRITADLASPIHAATSKATPVDADELALVDSAASNTLKKLTWANLKATLASWINGGTIASSFTTVKAATTIGVGAATPSASGAGVSFPATQSASTDVNTLDDYEEGTWTPAISGTTTAGAGTYSTQVGFYTKVGRAVHIQMNLTWSAHTGTGNMQVTGLPFAVKSTAFAALSVRVSDLALTANNIIQAYGISTIIDLQQYPAGGGLAAAIAMDTSATLMISGTYFV